MDPLFALATLAALVAVSALIGIGVRAAQGRVRADGQHVDRALTAEGVELTLLQLSSPVCSACAAMRRVGGQLASDDATIGHREIDVTEHPEMVRELGIMSTPTTLVVDRAGRVRSRIIGAATVDTVRQTLQDARTIREEVAA
ncbi:thioredoxin [Microcella alkaliphila]|uniref:Thioredoxin n=1 Tax=Microcella alkaliphila TaxID=279828 RepID=A0A4Q7TS31_9MICO|nr:thioredoxin family protein [Microcella alkaliphila]RZT62548.1 thioredoxin [Microcella alkaliphila]